MIALSNFLQHTGSKYLARDYALAAARVAHTSLSWRNALLPLHYTDDTQL